MSWLVIVLSVSVAVNIVQWLTIAAYRSEIRSAEQRQRNMRRILSTHARNGSKVS